MMRDLKQIDSKTADKLSTLRKDAVVLDRFYIPTRYPNGLPDITPDEAYLEEDAKACIEMAKRILKAVGDYLKK
jgi:HEPN domain-containing protein